MYTLDELEQLTTGNNWHLKKSPSITEDNVKSLWNSLNKLGHLVSTGEKVMAGCSKCKWGYIRVSKWDGYWRETQICECNKIAKKLNEMVTMFKSSWMPTNFLQNYNLSDYDEDLLPKLVLANLVNCTAKNRRLYLYWPPGTGKTYAGVVALQYALALWVDVMYVNVPTLLDRLRPNEIGGASEIIMKCSTCPVVLFDDMWQEKASEWVRERLYIILNDRYNRRLPTIITSNYDLKGLYEKLWHPALISRIRHLSGILEFVGDDKRVL